MVDLRDGDWRRIDDEARTRKEVMVRGGGNYSRAVWTGTMWAYAACNWHQLDFEPTQYRHDWPRSQELA